MNNIYINGELAPMLDNSKDVLTSIPVGEPTFLSVDNPQHPELPALTVLLELVEIDNDNYYFLML